MCQPHPPFAPPPAPSHIVFRLVKCLGLQLTCFMCINWYNIIENTCGDVLNIWIICFLVISVHFYLMWFSIYRHCPKNQELTESQKRWSMKMSTFSILDYYKVDGFNIENYKLIVLQPTTLYFRLCLNRSENYLE